MAGVDLNTTTSGVYLPESMSNTIWQGAGETSAVMRLAQRIDLPGNGLSIDLISGAATAYWQDGETGLKSVSRPTVGNKKIGAYMSYVQVPFSRKIRRDKAALYNAIERTLPEALAKLFDQTVYGYVAAPGANFGQLDGADSVSINTAGALYGTSLDVMTAVGVAGGDVNGYILSPQALAKYLAERTGEDNASGTPLFTPGGTLQNTVGNILGADIVRSKWVYYNPTETGTDTTADTLGWAGDWTKAYWGQVGAIQMEVLNEATLPDSTVEGGLLHLAARNMFAIRFEVEFGFQNESDDYFKRLTGAVTQ